MAKNAPAMSGSKTTGDRNDEREHATTSRHRDGSDASGGSGGSDGSDGSGQRKTGAKAPSGNKMTPSGTTQTTTGTDPVIKVRKPYTITKTRERWTDEEHKKFLEALKLYGRAWRKIEQHIGTKTAVQIRSHAQKFFSKLQKEQEKRPSESGSKGGSGHYVPDLDIHIPPARPKKKPAHPYPKKASSSQQPSGGSGGTGSGGTGSGGTGKSTGTAQKMDAEQVTNTASSAAVAAVLSVASDTMQANLQREMRSGYFGIPQAGNLYQPNPRMFPMQQMMNPYIGMANPAAGVQNPPQMSNPQQFVNYISMLANMWRQGPVGMAQSDHPNAPATDSKLNDVVQGNGPPAFVNNMGQHVVPDVAQPPPYPMAFTPDQFNAMQAYFVSIMQASAMGYMGSAPNSVPMPGMNGFVNANNATNASGADAKPSRQSRRDTAKKDDRSDGSDGSDGSARSMDEKIET